MQVGSGVVINAIHNSNKQFSSGICFGMKGFDGKAFLYFERKIEMFFVREPSAEPLLWSKPTQCEPGSGFITFFDKITAPRTPATIEAINMAILAASKSVCIGNASDAIKSDIVKPIPANAPAPVSCRQL